MKVAVGFDHAGFLLKETVLQAIREAGHEPIDMGTNSAEPVDFPDYSEKVGRAVQNGEAERGILVCGSGVGACIAANKMKGVYASICHDTYSAAQGVRHDDMNVLCLGARVIGVEAAAECIRAFLAARFSNAERHVRRVGKIRAIEADARAGKFDHPSGR